MNFASLQHSVFLQALGSAILNSLWQGFILWIIYETVNVSYKSSSSSFKNKLSTLLTFCAFAWFLSGLISGFFIEEELSSLPVSHFSASSVESSPASIFSIQSILAYAAGSLPYLSVSYIFLLFFLMAKLLSSYHYVHFITNKRLVSAPVKLQYFAKKVAGQINITRKISVWLSYHVDVPATIGFLKPVILIPVASINNLSNDQLEAIILHELSHIKRNDYITNLLISIIETILFFNPFILLLTKVIRRERENCCDDFVIQYRYDPHSYASALLSLEQARRSNLHLSMAAVSDKKQLLTRIQRITNSNVVSKQFNYGQKLIALILVTGIICSIAWLSPQEKKKNGASNLSAKEMESLVKSSPKVQKQITEIVNLDYQPGEINMAPELDNDHILSTSTKKLKSNPCKGCSIMNEGLKMLGEDLVQDYSPELYVDDDSKYSENHNRFFDKILLEFIPLQAFQDLSFQNLNLHIDLDELNISLKEAYKGITKMDRLKIQNEIGESLLKIKASEKDLLELYDESAKNLGINRKATKAKFAPELPLARFRTAFMIRDSLRTIETRSPRQSPPKVERRTTKSGQDSSGELAYAYHYNYDFEQGVIPTSEFSDQQKKDYSGNISIPFLNINDAKIIMDKMNQVGPKDKKSIHYFITKKSVNNTVQKRVVTIEINNAP